MTNQVPVEIRKFLENSMGGNLGDFLVEIHDGNKKGEGFLGDFYFVSLTNRRTNEVRHLAIKQALTSGTEDSLDFISKVFQNEICFYDKLWPKLAIFQKGFPNVKQFRKILKYYAVDATKGAEKISFENLKYQGFRNHVKSVPFEKQQLEYVMRTYGEFHAISMAYRAIDPEKLKKMTISLNDVGGMISEMEFIKKTMRECCQEILSTFDTDTEGEIIKKFKIYVEKGTDIFKEVQKYRGNKYAVLHGDCWSNNIMFKYDEHNNIEDLRLIDFQLTKLGSVVYDLSYCIYASGSKEAFNNLDHHLKIYHQSLSEALRKYDLNPELVYSFDDLKQEWKLYSKFGLIMGLVLNSAKHSDMEKMPLITDLLDKEGGEEESYFRKSEKFTEIGRSLVFHAYNNGYL